MKKMTPTPWWVTAEIQKDRNMCPVDYLEIYSAELPWWVAHVRADNTTGGPDAVAIVSAVNNTYGRGIRPEGVEGMYNALSEIVTLLNPLLPESVLSGIVKIARKGLKGATLTILSLLILASCAKSKPVPDIRSGGHGHPPESFYAKHPKV